MHIIIVPSACTVKYYGCVMSGNTKRGSITVQLTSCFDWFRLACFANKNKNCQLSYICFQTSQIGGEWYSDTPPLVFPGNEQKMVRLYNKSVSLLFRVILTGLDKHTNLTFIVYIMEQQCASPMKRINKKWSLYHLKNSFNMCCTKLHFPAGCNRA